MRPTLLLAAGILAASTLAPSAAHALDPSADCVSAGIEQPDGTVNITNPVGTIGCVTTNHQPGGAGRYVDAWAIDGFTVRVKSEGSAFRNSRVEVEFRNAATGERCLYTIRAGEVREQGACVV